MEKTREELFIYIFDMLEDLELIKWTKMYNRKLILEAFSQIDVFPYSYMEKKTSTFSLSMASVFNTHKKLNKTGNVSWDVYLLGLINYKKCSDCGKTLPYEHFYTRINRVSGMDSVCIKCSSKQCKIYRDNNKEDIAKNKKENRKINKQYIINELGGNCAICGYNRNTAALEFHHTDTNIKRLDYTIDEHGNNKSPSNYMLDVSFDEMRKRLENEKDNLSLLCANCHREIHNEDKLNE